MPTAAFCSLRSQVMYQREFLFMNSLSLLFIEEASVCLHFAVLGPNSCIKWSVHQSVWFDIHGGGLSHVYNGVFINPFSLIFIEEGSVCLLLHFAVLGPKSCIKWSVHQSVQFDIH